MATIIENEPIVLNPMGSMGVVKTIVNFFMDNFMWMGILILFAVLVGVVIAVVFMEAERRKEQEDMLYKEYKNTISSCKKNREDIMYTKKYSKWNLLWFGIPFMHYKIGRQDRDKNRNIIGFYDGLFPDDLGNMNLLVWKDKTFIFFKDHFLIRMPTKIYSLKKLKTKKQDGQQFKVDSNPLPNGLVTKSDFDLSITISSVGLKKFGYYYYPVYEDSNMEVLNLQESINAMNKINHSDELLLAVIKEGGKAVVGMAKQNTNLVYEQRTPEKVKEVESENN